MARQIGKMLSAREPKIVNGPEILNKYVGESESNIRFVFFNLLLLLGWMCLRLRGDCAEISPPRPYPDLDPDLDSDLDPNLNLNPDLKCR